MEYRKLGKSGIEASVVALGAFAMGGWMWGGTDEKQSMEAVHAALDHCAMRNAEQAAENAGAGSIELDNDEVAQMTWILNRYIPSLG